jgi:dipeptidyl aminopeptidase/acylaminoacyl peptidase
MIGTRAGAALRGACVALLLALAGCTVEAEHPALQQGELPALIAAHRFAYHGTLPGGYQFSPDGRKLVWIGPSWLRSVLHVRDNATETVRKYRVRSSTFHWTPSGRWLIYAADASAGENFHLYALDTDDAQAGPVDLTPHPGARATLHRVLAGPPESVLVYYNRRDSRLFDLYRIDLATGRETLVAKNPGDATAAVTGADGGFQGWKKSITAQRRAKGPPRPLADRRPALLRERHETFRALGASADRSVIWALSDRGRERVALVAAHPQLGWEKVVFEDPDVDVSHAVISRVTRAPLIAYADPGYPRFVILDTSLREDLGGLLQAQGDEPYGLEILSSDETEQRLVVTIYTDTARRYYLVDRAARSHVLLGEAAAAERGDLAAMRPVTIASRDGLRLHGYLTLPRGVPPRNLPLVLNVHGGPWMRTHWSDPIASEDAAYAQFLANRGYAVLQVDYRGSSGYGHAFMAAGYGEFAGRMQDDLLDAVRWAVDTGVADPARVAIMGWSYGGYAALVGLALTPDAFACGVSLNGPTDLASLIESFPPYWTVDLSRWHDYVGDPALAEDREQMTLKSPLHHVQNVRRPVLIVHGARDVRVRVDQAERMVEALRRGGKPVEYLRIGDMGHGLGYWAHRLQVLRRTEAFLQRCLGGRASRFDPFEAVAWVWARVGRWGAPPDRDGAGSGPSRPGKPGAK